MQKSATQEEICIRTGGDEFVVLAKHYDQQKEQQFMRSVRNHIDQALRRAGKSYRFSISIGCCRSVPNPADTTSIQSEAEQYLRNADQTMYEEKQASSDRRE
jgi:diguanylate cyclase (GGDEF)-like protein